MIQLPRWNQAKAGFQSPRCDFCELQRGFFVCTYYTEEMSGLQGLRQYFFSVQYRHGNQTNGQAAQTGRRAPECSP